MPLKDTALCALIGIALLGSACATTPKTTDTPAVSASETNSPAELSKYDKLVYGQELPLVCSNPVMAEGRFTHRPNLQLMWENYLYDRPEGIWGEIGGKVEVNGNLPEDQGRWTNACTVRLSYMLNQAGQKIEKDGNKTVSGGNGDQYYYRVRDMEEYLTYHFGAPDLAITDGSADSFDIPPKPGILLMDFPGSTFSGHVTIWNGAGSVDGADIGGHRVLFWEMPCFTPKDREAPVAMLDFNSVAFSAQNGNAH